MDQLKPFIALAKKHLFWIISAVVLCLTVATYYMTSKAYETQRTTYTANIDKDFKQAKNVKEAGEVTDLGKFHPNDETHTGMLELTKVAKRELGEAWMIQWKAQQPLLTWPEEKLGAENVARFRGLRPIEKMVPFVEEAGTPAEESMARIQVRKAYQELVRDALPDLASKIGDVWLPEANRPGVKPERKREIQRAKRVVEWDEKNQSYWESRFTNFNNKFNEDRTGTPRLLQILYAQEDMWVLDSILKDIIAKTNGDAKANDLAKIKKIDHIYIGHDAQGINGQVEIAGKEKPAEGSGDAAGDMSMEMMMQMMMSQSTTSEGGTAAAEAKPTYGDGTTDPANGRYVDRDFQPLDATTLRQSFTAMNKDLAYLAVAKRIPVRIGLQMDERAIWDLVANCANARLPLEVRQVRINAHTPGLVGSLASHFTGITGTTAKPAGTSGTTSDGMDENMMMMMMAAQGEGTETGGAITEKIDTSSGFDVPVEIYGIISLYNPPDSTVLGDPNESQPAAPTDPTASHSADQPVADNRKS
jgi:hypothetical protein